MIWDNCSTSIDGSSASATPPPARSAQVHVMPSRRATRRPVVAAGPVIKFIVWTKPAGRRRPRRLQAAPRVTRGADARSGWVASAAYIIAASMRPLVLVVTLTLVPASPRRRARPVEPEFRVSTCPERPERRPSAPTAPATSMVWPAAPARTALRTASSDVLCRMSAPQGPEFRVNTTHERRYRGVAT